MGRSFTEVTTSPGARSTPCQKAGGRKETISQPRKRPSSRLGSTSTCWRKFQKPAFTKATTSARLRVPDGRLGAAGGGGVFFATGADLGSGDEEPQPARPR